MFSAPQRIGELAREWGWPLLEQRYQAALLRFAADAGSWLEILRHRGLEGAAAVYREVLDDASSSADAHVSTWVDGCRAERKHHYMSTRQADPGPADGPAAAGDDAGAGRDPASDRGAGTAEKVRGWLAGRLPAGWFTDVPDIEVDREEITVLGTLADPAAAGDSEADRAAAAAGKVRRFREDTRSQRIEIAREAEHRFRRKVSWGVSCANVTEMFTTLSVPVMTRLRQPERRVLDTLVDAGVARSRSDALAWCVRLTGENADSWLSRLRAALRQVEEVRDQGPGST